MFSGFIFKPGLQLSSAAVTGVQGCVYAASAAAAAVRTYISDSGSGSDLSRRTGYAMNDKGEHRKVLFFPSMPPLITPAKERRQNLSFLNKKFG